MKEKFKKFLETKSINADQYSELDASKQAELHIEFQEQEQKHLEGLIEGKASKEDIEKATSEMKEIIDLQNKAIFEAIKTLQQDAKAQKEIPAKDAKKALKDYIAENSEVLKGIMAKGENAKMLDITIKGTQGATDIGQRTDYAEILPGTYRKPVRKPLILDLFKRKKVSKEFIKYREENVVTRDAKFVIACATSTHTTKKTWQNRTVELAKIRDIVDICLDMLDDYDFVESEIRELIEESIKLKADYELLLGASVATTDMLSIDFISSEFNPDNVLAPFAGAFEKANIEQLADAMAAQINIFGQQNAWMADTVVMNYRDFILYRNLKDANGNKLIKTLSDGTATLAGMRIVTSPIVPSNEMYVFDSTKGTILDRQMLTVKTSYENRDNIEHEMVTFVAVERLQFHVPIVHRDAFMKVSNVTEAIEDITKPEA